MKTYQSEDKGNTLEEVIHTYETALPTEEEFYHLPAPYLVLAPYRKKSSTGVIARRYAFLLDVSNGWRGSGESW